MTWFFLTILGEFEEESKQPGVSEQQRHQLKHRELFLSRQFESLPATHIRYRTIRVTVVYVPLFRRWREGGGVLEMAGKEGCSSRTFGFVLFLRGKCSVTLLNETDILNQYLDKEVMSSLDKR